MRDMIVCCASKHAHTNISKRSMRKRQGETFILILKYDLQLLYPLYYLYYSCVYSFRALYSYYNRTGGNFCPTHLYNGVSKLFSPVLTICTAESCMASAGNSQM